MRPLPIIRVLPGPNPQGISCPAPLGLAQPPHFLDQVFHCFTPAQASLLRELHSCPGPAFVGPDNILHANELPVNGAHSKAEFPVHRVAALEPDKIPRRVALAPTGWRLREAQLTAFPASLIEHQDKDILA